MEPGIYARELAVYKYIYAYENPIAGARAAGVQAHEPLGIRGRFEQAVAKYQRW